MRASLIRSVVGGSLFPGLLLLPLLAGGVGRHTEAEGSIASLAGVPAAGGPEASPDVVSLRVAEAELPAGPYRAPGGRVRTFAPRGAPFPARSEGVEIHFAVQAITVLSGGVLTLEAPEGVALLAKDGEVAPVSPGRWRWQAPGEAGVVPLRLQGSEGTIDLNILVMRPKTEVKNGVLNGYRIGTYAGDPSSPNPLHRPPTGFIEVHPEDEDILVAPHFTLGQFLCKDPGEPRYVVLSNPLLVKLEAVLAAVNREGYSTPTLHVMSGYRTPAYNRAIGNTTDLSRHLWGDAADIFIDNNGNGTMDDLNRDGRVDDADAHILMRVVERVDGSGAHGVEAGGLHLYPTIPGRGPFVHVDARGVAARW